MVILELSRTAHKSYKVQVGLKRVGNDRKRDCRVGY